MARELVRGSTASFHFGAASTKSTVVNKAISAGIWNVPSPYDTLFGFGIKSKLFFCALLKQGCNKINRSREIIRMSSFRISLMLQISQIFFYRHSLHFN